MGSAINKLWNMAGDLKEHKTKQKNGLAATFCVSLQPFSSGNACDNERKLSWSVQQHAPPSPVNALYDVRNTRLPEE